MVFCWPDFESVHLNDLKAIGDIGVVGVVGVVGIISVYKFSQPFEFAKK